MTSQSLHNSTTPDQSASTSNVLTSPTSEARKLSESSALNDATAADEHFREPRIPPSETPRVWFVTAGDSPICVSVTKQLLEHGDYVVAGVEQAVMPGREAERAELEALAEQYSVGSTPSSRASVTSQAELEEGYEHTAQHAGSLLIVPFSTTSLSSIQSGYAKAISHCGRIDVLLVGNSETVVGTVEELGASSAAQSLLQDQFATNFFGPVNAIKSIMSVFRLAKPQEQASSADPESGAEPVGHEASTYAANIAVEETGTAVSSGEPPLPPGGHIVLLSGISGHVGTPGLPAYCASQWAVEGYCDSLAYEVAPFNIRISILQSNIEVGVLTNPIKAVPSLSTAYGTGSLGHKAAEEEFDGLQVDDDDPSSNKAPLARGWLSSLVERLEKASGQAPSGSQDIISARTLTNIGCPPLPRAFRDALIAETVHAVLEIGGHENPPARHIVGFEGVASVKEKLKTVSEELEDFVTVSTSVDL